MAYCIVSSVGFYDCTARALIGHRRVLSTARPKNRDFPHSCCMKFLPFASSGGADNSCCAYCCLAPYLILACGYGAFCLHCRSCWKSVNAFLT
jgi:hypothetical protein